MTDPVELFRRQYAEARDAGVPKYDAVALATCSAEGVPSVRMVLLKDADERGFVFYTNLGSRKARDLAANPRAALCFYWEPTGRQVRVEGEVERVTDEEADAYFATRPRGSQIGAWASRQSEPLEDRAELLTNVHRVVQKFAGGEVPRPPFWSGFRLVPRAIEFWRNEEDRLHDRQRFTRTADGWASQLLQP